jgi:AraC family transcriptional regulator of arabinose operon
LLVFFFYTRNDVDAIDHMLIYMDYLMKITEADSAGQRLILVSRELLKRAAHLPVSRNLHVTGIGHFPGDSPGAIHRSVSRPKGFEAFILIFCANGQGHLTLSKRRHRLLPGQLVLIPPGLPHSYKTDRTLPWNIYWVHFTGEQAAEYGAMLGLSGADPILQIADPDLLIRQFESLYACVSEAFSDSALICGSAHLTQMLCLLNSLRTEKYERSRRSEQRILKSIDYILREYHASHTLDDLARSAGLSIPHYGALFRKQTGVSPVLYLIRVRLRHACMLLDHSSLSLSEIARAVGYEDQFYFSRLFRKNIGLSPREYRKVNPYRPDSPRQRQLV